MTDDVLDTDLQNTPDKTDNASNTDQYSDLLNAIKREDGSPKYDDVPKALEALAASQSHISKIEVENEALRGVADKVTSLEQLIVKMQAPAAPDQNVNNNTQTNGNTMTEDQLDAMIAKQLTQASTNQTVMANRTEFNNALKEKFGDKAPQEFHEALTSKGLTKEEVAGIVQRSPASAIAILGLDTKVPNNSETPRSTVMSPQHPSTPIDLNGVPVQQEGESKTDFFNRISNYYKG